ncbi:MAG: ATP phosphoribosyltransferase [Spirochaetaceae bacterium]|nr:MAG: ATP phosphoribosyltransferase [Spirochaetaceae bacterium]
MRRPTEPPLTIAVPKGRLHDQVRELFERCGLAFDFAARKLVAEDRGGMVRLMLVKNSDVPVYVNHGIAGLGVCGDDVLYETAFDCFRLLTFPFGGTRMCLAARRDHDPNQDHGRLRVATKFTRFAHDFFHQRGIPVEVIRLGGSVELAPVLGLAPYIVDLVETGSTLAANDLVVTEELERISVHLIANPAYYKFRYAQVDRLVQRLEPCIVAQGVKDESTTG